MTDVNQADEHLRALPLPTKSENLDAILRDMKSCVERFERWSRDQRQQIDVLKRNVGSM